MPDAMLTAGQEHAIAVADALMEAAGLPTYTAVLGEWAASTRPLSAADTIELGPLETSEREAIPFRLALPEAA